MKLFDIIKDANQNLLRNKLRTFLTILAIFIGSFSIISTSAIQAGVNDFIDSQVDSYGGLRLPAACSKLRSCITDRVGTRGCSGIMPSVVR